MVCIISISRNETLSLVNAKIEEAVSNNFRHIHLYDGEGDRRDRNFEIIIRYTDSDREDLEFPLEYSYDLGALAQDVREVLERDEILPDEEAQEYDYDREYQKSEDAAWEAVQAEIAAPALIRHIQQEFREHGLYQKE